MPSPEYPLRISHTFSFRENASDNQLGLATGDVHQIGAFVMPSGAATLVRMSLNTQSISLSHRPQPLFPHLYELCFPFSVANAKSWSIEAEKGEDVASATPKIVKPVPRMPLVRALDIDEKARVATWIWPKLPSKVLQQGICVFSTRLYSVDTAEVIFSSWPPEQGQRKVDDGQIILLGPSEPSRLVREPGPREMRIGKPGERQQMALPDIQYEPGVSYVLRVGINLMDRNGISTLSRSSTYSRPFELG